MDGYCWLIREDNVVLGSPIYVYDSTELYELVESHI